MKKKITIVFAIIFAILLILIVMYLVDRYMMENNKPVVFSTWGYDYAPPVNKYEILEIIDSSDNYSCAQALEKIYEDSENEYYFSTIKSEFIIVKYKNGGQANIKVALNIGQISLEDLDRFGIKYITKEKENDGVEKFTATVLDAKETYMLVEPDETELERRSADQIVVSFASEDLNKKYETDTKVVIYYSGSIMESYPARINADKIEVAN